MPQDRRRNAFSNKQKKAQLQDKREKKKAASEEAAATPAQRLAQIEVNRLNQQPVTKVLDDYDPNRYRLHFQRDSKEEVERRKKLSRLPFKILPEQALEMDMDDIYQPGSVLDIPKRPPWDYKMKKESLEAREVEYFKDYLRQIYDKHPPESLSYFEFNLETWRQLWRVLELSDIVLLITDIRHPALHFSPALYDHVVNDLKKHIIIVLNKTDLVSPSIVVAWKHYFQEKFPKLHVVTFTVFPKDESEQEEFTKDPGKTFHKRRRKRLCEAVGPVELLDAVMSIVKEKVDLTSWREKIEHDMAEAVEEEDNDDEGSGDEGAVKTQFEVDTSYHKHEEFKDGVVSIGCVGYPNVGKSSLLNGLVGTKVVSVSKTPGHTKHFQTIFLTPTVRLVDCPGLVFPSLVEKPMQILAGIYPIAQVQEPFSAIMFLAQRINLPKLLKLKHPEAEEKGSHAEWSAFDICDAWAEKRGFLTAKAARNDVYRAANNILRLASDGRICLCMRPPGYSKNKAMWETAEETLQLRDKIGKVLSNRQLTGRQARLAADELAKDEEDDDSDENEEGESEEEEEEDDEPIGSSNPFALLADD